MVTVMPAQLNPICFQLRKHSKATGLGLGLVCGAPQVHHRELYSHLFSIHIGLPLRLWIVIKWKRGSVQRISGLLCCTFLCWRDGYSLTYPVCQWTCNYLCLFYWFNLAGMQYVYCVFLLCICVNYACIVQCYLLLLQQFLPHYSLSNH